MAVGDFFNLGAGPSPAYSSSDLSRAASAANATELPSGAANDPVMQSVIDRLKARAAAAKTGATLGPSATTTATAAAPAETGVAYQTGLRFGQVAKMLSQMGRATVAPTAAASAIAGGTAALGGGSTDEQLTAALHPLDFIGTGLGETAARFMLSPSERAAADKVGVESGYDTMFGNKSARAGAAAVAPTGLGAKPAGAPFVLPAQQPRNMSVPGGSASPDQPSPTAPAVAAATAPVYKITNADGSVSYSNVAADVANAQNTKSSVEQMGAQPTSKGVVTGTQGTFNVVPGVSDADRARAISSAVGEKQYALARGMAKTPEDIASIEQAEQMRDQLSAVTGRGGKLDKTLAATLAGHMLTLQGTKATAKAANQAAMLKYITDTIIKRPEMEKTGAETNKLNLQMQQSIRDLASGKITGPEFVALLSGHPLPSAAADVKVDTSVLPGTGQSALKVFTRGAGGKPVMSEPAVSAQVGSTFMLDGKLYIAGPNGQHTLAPGQ